MTKGPNWTRQLALASGLLVLGGFAYWLEYKHKPESEKKEEQSKKWLDLGEGAQIESVSILDGDKRFSFKCLDVSLKLCKVGDPAKWQMTEPATYLADDANVNGAISALAGISSQDTLDLSSEKPEKQLALLTEYGLDSKKRAEATSRKVIFSLAGGKKVTGFVGNPHPIGDKLFALVANGDQVDEKRVLLLTSFAVKSPFEHDLTHWRNKKILAFAAHEIQRFELKGTGSHNAQAERKDGQWQVKNAAGASYPGDLEGIDQWLSGLQGLSAKSFANTADLAGAKPVGDVLFVQEVLGDKGAKKTVEHRLKVTEKSGKDKSIHVYAQVAGNETIYEVEENVRTRLAKSASDFRQAKLLTSLERYAMTRMEWKGKALGAVSLVAESKDGKWTVNGKPVDAGRASSVLDAFSNNRVTKFLEGTAIPAGEGTGIQVTLSDDKKEKVREFAFWKSGSRVLARDLRSPRKEAFEFASGVQNQIPFSADFFEKKNEPAAPPSGGGEMDGLPQNLDDMHLGEDAGHDHDH